MADLKFWRDQRAICDGQPLWPSTHVDTIFYSDASSFGWGGWQRRPDGSTDVAHGLFSPSQAASSSTLREALGLEGTLRSLPDTAGKDLRAIVDNQALEWAWWHGSRVPEINQVVINIYLFLRRIGARLSVFWLPRSLNQRADAISKLYDHNDWQLNPSVFSFLDARWGPHTFDRFASHRNAQCANFSSAFWCPGTAGVDAFSFDWAGENNWINPPFALIPRVIQHLRLCQAAATVICPFWPKRPWWHMVCPDGKNFASFVVDFIELDQSRRDLFSRPGSEGGVGSPHWRVFALRVDFTPKTVGERPANARRRYTWRRSV